MAKNLFLFFLLLFIFLTTVSLAIDEFYQGTCLREIPKGENVHMESCGRDVSVSPPEYLALSLHIRKEDRINLLIAIVGGIIATTLMVLMQPIVKWVRTWFQIPHVYNFKRLNFATANFTTILNSAHDERVYMGVFDDNTIVAVKVMPRNSMTALAFYRTVLLLPRMEHDRFVPFLGWSVRNKNRYLVYKFMKYRSLQEALDNNSTQPQGRLDWYKRLQIAADIAQGIRYFHSRCFAFTAHGNLKSSNILIDENIRARLSCFFWTDGQGETARKHDMYSLGIILLELIMGGRAGLGNKRSAKIHRWVNTLFRVDNQLARPDEAWTVLQNLIDPNLHQYNKDSMKRIALLAFDCINNEANNRPNISHVLLRIHHAISIEDSCERNPS